MAEENPRPAHHFQPYVILDDKLAHLQSSHLLLPLLMITVFILLMSAGKKKKKVLLSWAVCTRGCLNPRS